MSAASPMESEELRKGKQAAAAARMNRKKTDMGERVAWEWQMLNNQPAAGAVARPYHALYL